MAMQVKLELGHRASLRTKKTPEGYTHDWSVFVRGPEGTNIEHFIDRVVFYLHESFPRAKRVVKEPPYQVTETGYAGFLLPIEVVFRNQEPRSVRFDYDLFLQSTGPPINHVRLEKLTFQKPSDDFKKKLLKGGGVAVGVGESSGEKAPNRGGEKEKNATSAIEPVGGKGGKGKGGGGAAEVKKPSLSSHVGIGSSGHAIASTKSKSKDSGEKEKGRDLEKEREREKEKEKEREREREREREKEKEKEKEREREREREKEKDRAREKEKKNALGRKDPFSSLFGEPIKTLKQEREKGKEKDKEKEVEKEKDKEKGKEREKKEEKEGKEERRSLSKGKKEAKRPLTDDFHHRHVPDKKPKLEEDKKKERAKEKREKHKPKKDREKEKEKEKVEVEKKLEKVEVEKKPEIKNKLASESHGVEKLKNGLKSSKGEEKKHKKVKMGSEEKNPKKEKEKEPERKIALSAAKKISVSPVPEKVKDVKSSQNHSQTHVHVNGHVADSSRTEPSSNNVFRKLMAELGSDDDDSSKSSEDVAPVFSSKTETVEAKGTVILSSDSEPEMRKRKKPSGERHKKMKKKRKRKKGSGSSHSDSSDSPSESEDESGVESQRRREVSSSSDDDRDPNANLRLNANESVKSTPRPLSSSSEDHYSQLLDLHRRIMDLRDCDLLQKIVDVIKETGQFEITNTTFDFNLCALDKGTIQRLQNCF